MEHIPAQSIKPANNQEVVYASHSCVFNPKGMSERNCSELSGVLRNAARCAAFGGTCQSLSRRCVACVRQGGELQPIAKLGTLLCAFHLQNGENARQVRAGERNIAVNREAESSTPVPLRSRIVRRRPVYCIEAAPKPAERPDVFVPGFRDLSEEPQYQKPHDSVAPAPLSPPAKPVEVAKPVEEVAELAHVEVAEKEMPRALILLLPPPPRLLLLAKPVEVVKVEEEATVTAVVAGGKKDDEMLRSQLAAPVWRLYKQQKKATTH